MPDTVAAEWDKTRFTRSTAVILAVVAALVPVAMLFIWLGVDSWDSLSDAKRAKFGAIPMERYLLPMAQLCMGVYGTLAVTSEYASRMIDASVVATPRRSRLLAAKCVVVAAVSAAAGVAMTTSVFVSTRWIVGDRPIPNHTAPFSDEWPMLLSMGLSVGVVALIGLGLGTVTRSTAAPIVVLSALLFVVPVLTQFLPESWAEEANAVMLPALPAQIVGGAAEGRSPVAGPFADLGVLSPLTALAVTVGYVVLAVGAAALVLARRDV